MRLLKILFLFILILLAGMVSAGTIRISESGKPIAELSSYSENNFPYVSAEALCSAFGGETQWDTIQGRLGLRMDSISVFILPGNPFVRSGEQVFQVFPEPVWDGQGMWIPLKPWMSLLNGILGKNVSEAVEPVPLEPKSAEKKGSDPGVLSAKIPAQEKKKTGPPPAVSNGKFDKIKTIVLDPGHGGKDPGALGPKGLVEKRIVLEIAKKVKKILEEKKDLKIILTRDKDTFIELGNRTKIANDSSADLFLSIHCNSIGSKKQSRTSGFKAYINKAAQSDEDRLVAMKENAAIQFEVTEDRKKGLTETEGILLDILNTEFLRESEDWASMVVDEMENGVPQVSPQHTGVGQAGFYVLAGAFMPAVLMEVAYISHPEESQLLTSSRFQEKVAQALAQSVFRFKEKYEK